MFCYSDSLHDVNRYTIITVQREIHTVPCVIIKQNTKWLLESPRGDASPSCSAVIEILKLKCPRDHNGGEVE